MSLLRDYASSLAQPTLPFGPGEGDRGVRFDEVVAPDGTLRPAWKGMAALTVELTAGDFDRVDREITALLADDGVTYGSLEAGSQPWQLDPMPLVLDAATWGRLEVGLAQRAELLNALLADVYGDRRLLAEGLIPAAAIFGHAGYTRPIARTTGFDPHPLILSGTDVGRDAAGEWRVLADRVQAPSGLGYAMANRRVISRVIPELYDEAGLHRMEPYFSALRSALLQAAPAEVADPRVVVLSPGTHSETAYDQAFLANILGFPLVQGGDMVVRDGWVWMKPSGFPRQAPVERVDVILRRVDADWCDPLELRGNSQLGVAGLTEAVRRGRVRLVNGLGAGVLENPALMPFLPAVCERLLGEQLRLPSVTTWWCGSAEGMDAVLDGIARDRAGLIVRTIDGHAADLVDRDDAELRDLILAAPHRYVGQERLPLSQAPGWGDAGRRTGHVMPHPVVLRTFTVRDGAAYRPLVGGLATLVDDGQTAPSTKDVWVLKASPGDPDQGLAGVTPLAVPRVAPVLGPRALEDMFWVGRYAERAEDLIRLVITAHAHAEQLDFSSSVQGDAVLGALIGALRRLCGTRWLEADAELRSLLLDVDRPGSSAHSLDKLRDALEGVRDQLSGDTWRVFGITDQAMKLLRVSRRSLQIAESAGRMLSGLLSLQGVTASMMRDDGWHAIEIGRYLERSVQVCSLLAATTTVPTGAGVERAVLSGVLMAAESAVTHRRRYRGGVRVSGVLELLLSDPDNPRSVGFCLARVREHLGKLSASTGSTRPERLLEHLEDSLESTDIAALAASEEGSRPRLAAFLSDTRAHLHQLGEAIGHVHFEGGPRPQSLSALALIEVGGATTGGFP
ncbi:circularly permuted type 2 ATP-grasp protein [uncultured Microbacterium sp.]|uniref:circularly permuted type 2 ATP-grasp protein n=1 Tax=uncultured Microbacterium sp. TaxID=191216 RepID=UPI0035CB5257